MIQEDKSNYTYHPQTKEELREILEERLSKNQDADLNDIDVSYITDMGLFKNNIGLFEGLDPHNIDISKWNVSNVEDMSYMFYYCKNFNSDLSKWNVSNVKYMDYMFEECYEFNSDLSGWNVSKVEDMQGMFAYCKNFNSDLSNWDVSKVRNMNNMFWECNKFNSELNSWDVSQVKNMQYMFFDCTIEKNPPKWYKSYDTRR